MSEIKTAKCMAILFGMGIVVCTYFLFLRAFAGKAAAVGGKTRVELEKFSETAEIKGFQVNNGKIYFLVAEPSKESVRVFDEASLAEVRDIVLKKEKINE